MAEKYIALSLGWGVQSFTLAAMAALGEIEMPDVAIHADTMHESVLTYRFAEKWTSWLRERGVNVVQVQNVIGGIQKALERNQLYIPAFTRNDKGKAGQLMRTCTHRWKVISMRRWISKQRLGKHVEMWMGISTDEALRMKNSDVKYITNRYPLIERRMSRDDCKRFLECNGLEIPPKSACTFCPYRDTEQWRYIMGIDADWREAVTVDRAIRDVRPGFKCFVHPARKPLEEVDLRTLEEMGQMRLWDDECEGICGV